MRVLLLTILLAGAPIMAVETGPLSDQESKFQGDWQAYDVKSSQELYKMKFEGRDFRAETGDAWYEGYIAIRTDTEPAHLDFMIEDCRCGFKGRASTGIFYWDGETIVVSAPEPGAARPQEFEQSGGTMFRLKPEGRD